MKLKLFEMTYDQLVHEMKRRYGKGPFHAAALYRGIFKEGRRSFSDIPEFCASPLVVENLEGDATMPQCRIAHRLEDGVLKFASALDDGLLTESVMIPAHGRTTLCVSSQVGCRMGCVFCLTGSMGFLRNLTVEEIVQQVYITKFVLKQPVHNIVFMGMGEPLDNFANVVQAIRVMSDQRGLDIALRHITVSTSGHVEGIRKLSLSDVRKIHLAVSVNAPDNDLRNRLMPINRKYPLERLKEELQRFPLGHNGVILIEYVLLQGVNDSRSCAKALAFYLAGLPTRVNIIPFNGGATSQFTGPSLEQAELFCRWLRDEKLFACVRRSRGQSILAACGQLGASYYFKGLQEAVEHPRPHEEQEDGEYPFEPGHGKAVGEPDSEGSSDDTGADQPHQCRKIDIPK